MHWSSFIAAGDSKRGAWVAALMVTVIWTPAAWAQWSPPLKGNAADLSIEKKASASDLVVIGRVLELQSRWNGKIIVTTARVAPAKVLKGRTKEKTLSVSFLGGTVGDIQQTATDETTLESGELAVLFLQDAPQGIFEAGTKTIATRNGKIQLLAPGFKPARLKHDQRLLQRIGDITNQVSKGG